MTISSYKNEVLDVMKAITIILVVVAHVTRMYTPQSAISFPANCTLLEYTTTIIYEFHMPCFFMVSGAVFYITKTIKKKYNNWSTFLSIKSRRLLIPYVCISVFCVFPTMYFLGLTDGETWDYFFHSYVLMEDPRHLWFIIALFGIYMMVNLFYGFITRFPHVFLVMCFILHLFSSHLPATFQLNHINFYLLYFYLGYYLYRQVESWRIDMLIAPMTVISLAFVIFKETVVSWIGVLTTFGPLIKLVNIIAALCGSFLIYGISYFISKYHLGGQYLKKFIPDTFGIYLFHPMLIYILFFYLKDIHISPYILSLVILLVSLGGSLGMIKLSRWLHANFIIGEHHWHKLPDEVQGCILER